jgi:hypothetical protein
MLTKEEQEGNIGNNKAIGKSQQIGGGAGRRMHEG